MKTDGKLVTAMTKGGRARALMILLVVLMAGTVAALSVSATSTVLQSKVATAAQLAAHGIELTPLPAGVAAAVVSETAGAAAANELLKSPKGPNETYRVLASATYFSPKQTAWLYLYIGGPGFGSVGPVEGAGSRTFSSDYTGVLVDDQTGAVLRWFQGGSFTP
ncbi:MAG: hypothetical protein HYX55_11505 [Chloroflexi bacterium]|nr:hypothetical protein [Chloroflexota bacterium]